MTRGKVAGDPASPAQTPADKLLALQAAVAQGGISSVMEGGDSNGATGFGEAAGEAAFGLGAVEAQPAEAAPGASAKAGGPGSKAGGPGSKSERGSGGRGKGGGKGGGGGGKGGGMPMGMMSGMMGGTPGAGAPAGGFQVLMQGWPAMDSTSGRKMAALCEQPGIIRHDIRVAKPIVGRLIGSGGATFRDLSQRTGASIFVLDKEGPPPGWSNDWRLVIIMGYEAQVIHAIQEVETLIGSSPLLSGGGAAAPHKPQQGGYGGYAGYGAAGQIGAAGPPGQTASGLGSILVTGWPTAAEPSGRRMASLEQTPGMIRHDMLVLKPYVGRLIGQGGATYRELQTRTGCTIFILDKEGPPPGFPDDQRLVSLMGFEPQVVQAEAEVTALLSSASQRPPTAGKGGGAAAPGGGRGSGGYGGGMGGMYGQQPPAPFCDVTTMGGGGAYPGAAAAGYGGYAAPAPLGYGAPAPVSYGAPAAGAYGAAAAGAYGAPALGGYGAPAPTGYAPPANTGYGGYGGYAAAPADPYAAAGALGAGYGAAAGAQYGAAAGAAGAAYGAADPAYGGGAPAYYNDANYAGGAYGEYEQRGVKRTAYGQ